MGLLTEQLRQFCLSFGKTNNPLKISLNAGFAMKQLTKIKNKLKFMQVSLNTIVHARISSLGCSDTYNVEGHFCYHALK